MAISPKTSQRRSKNDNDDDDPRRGLQTLLTSRSASLKMEILEEMIAQSKYDQEDNDDDTSHNNNNSSSFHRSNKEEWESQVMEFLDADDCDPKSVQDDEEKRRILKGILCFPARDENDRRKAAAEQQQQEQIKKKKNKPKLTFNEHVRSKDIPHINDMSSDEISDVYMTPNDFKRIRNECLQLVQQKDFTKDGYLLRGLDKQTNSYQSRRDDIHYQVQDTVFLIQELARNQRYQLQQMQKEKEKAKKQQQQQHQNGDNPPNEGEEEDEKDANIVSEYEDDVMEFLAKVCAKKSEPAVIAAHTAAISDLFSVHKDTWTQRHIPTVLPTDEDELEEGQEPGGQGVAEP